MKWSWKLGEIRGIGVYMHATFLILIGFVVLSHYSAGHSVAKTLEGVGFILAIFACVVLHEFGHALMAARYGIKTKDITLLPIGGVARLERMPEKPIEELWVALAGPAVNVVIAAGLFAWIQFADAFAPLEQLSVTSGPFLERLLMVNIILVVFNMLPAFPMDGGRVLRALLATRLEYARATQIAASVSVDANDTLDTALTRIQASECCLTAPVMQHDKMVGLLTAENVREFLLIASALGERQKQKVAIAS